MYVFNDILLINKITLLNLSKCFSEVARVPLDPPLVIIYRGNWNLTMAASNSNMWCALYEISRSKTQHRPSEAWTLVEGSQHCCPHSQNFWETVPHCPHIIYVTASEPLKRLAVHRYFSHLWQMIGLLMPKRSWTMILLKSLHKMVRTALYFYSSL